MPLHGSSQSRETFGVKHQGEPPEASGPGECWSPSGLVLLSFWDEHSREAGAPQLLSKSTAFVWISFEEAALCAQIPPQYKPRHGQMGAALKCTPGEFTHPGVNKNLS